MQASIAANTYVVSGPAQTKSAPHAVTVTCLPHLCRRSDVRSCKLCVLHTVHVYIYLACCKHAAQLATDAPGNPCAEVSEMMPGIMNQLGPDNMKDIRKMMGAVRGCLPSQRLPVCHRISHVCARSQTETSLADLASERCPASRSPFHALLWEKSTQARLLM